MNHSSSKKKRKSVYMEIALTYLALIVVVVGSCVLVNSFFLDKYYVRNKVNVLKSAYEIINEALSSGNTDELSLEVQHLSDTYNISAVVLNESMGIIVSSVNDTGFIERQLLKNLFGNKELEKSERLIEEGTDYTIQIRTDVMTQDKYIEMWGVTGSGYVFIIRSAMDSIAESVAIANRFLIYIGLATGIVSMILGLIASKRITRPISELTEISERMKSLDFNAKYTGNDRNEIGVLGENINELSETLKSTISELKSANAKLERDIARKTEIDDMRKEFLSNVSHELKTPIALIQGYAEGLKDCVNDDDESRDYYCDVIVDESAKMNSIVGKLLTLNQLEFGNEDINMERFDITEVIGGYLQSAEILVRQHEATVHFTHDEDLYVWGDADKALEVFNNYFSNALNHLAGERVIDIRAQKSDNKVRVSVFNTGEPIPEAELDHIWEKFYKVDKARTREYGGSGVGLSIVKAIQESIGERYGVINHRDGVEFYFELDGSDK